MTEKSTEGTPRGKRELAVTHHFEIELDVDRLDEWVGTNITDGRVQVTDAETGEVLYDGF